MVGRMTPQRLALSACVLALLHVAPAFSQNATSRPAGQRVPVPTTLPTEARKPYLHEPTGFTFPADVGAFQRVGVYQFDERGRNVSAGYGDRALRIVMTLYIYPRQGQAAAGHFERVKADVLKVAPEAKWVEGGAWTLRQGDREYAGFRGTYRMTRRFNGADQEVLSEAYLLAHGEQFVKYRITYPSADAGAARLRVDAFLERFALPELKPQPAGG
jgi:hypothetical protein